GELGDALDAVAGIDREMSADLDKCRAECAGEYAAAAERLRRQLDSDGDADVFAKGCAEISDKFDRQFSAAHSELDVRYRNKIAQTMDTAIEKMHMGRRETERAIEQIEDAEERKAQYAKVTKERIESLSAQIDKLSARFDGKKAAEAVRILTEQLAQARANLEGGLTEAALIDVFSAEDLLYLRVSEMATDEVMLKNHYIRAAEDIARLSGTYEKLREGELKTERTASGLEAERHIDDMPFYYRGEYEKIGEEIARITDELDITYTDFTQEELISVGERIKQLNSRLIKETETAYERLYCEHLRKETAKVLVKRYRSKGYELIPLTEEDKKISPLDRITVRLENADTGERLELMLNSVNDDDGHISMDIAIEDHTSYEGTLDEVERIREKERLDTIAALRDTDIAKDLPLRQRCKNPGVKE
ncbi:MAG: hypothetical protein IJ080_02595, partial [Oscillospiraceae bacterium]|nr:hypothetical protein [Oscillospiraceae bacterium]